MEKPLVNNNYLLHKFPGKGGWTYASIPEILPDKKAPFGWVQVKGTIDNYAIDHYKLMPMGNGKLFLPVKAAIRKKIGKKEGEYIHVILYADNSPVEIPEELLLCLQDSPEANETFMNSTESEKKFIIDRIFSAKNMHTRIDRMAAAINELEKNHKTHRK